MASFVQAAGTAGSSSTPFTDDSGFSVFLPGGWVGEDIDNTSPSSQSAESQLGYGILAIFCPQEQALPQIGGRSSCEPAEDAAYVFRYKDLGSRPEFASLPSNYEITAEDMMAYDFGRESPLGFHNNLEIVLSEDISVHSGSIPAILTLATYYSETSSGLQVQIASFRMHFVVEDIATGKVHGYSLEWERPSILVSDATERGIAEDFGSLAGSIFLTGIPVIAQQVIERNYSALRLQQERQYLS